MKLFVWDFHGVLEKGNESSVVEITNKVLEQNGFAERIILEQVYRYYGRPWADYFQGLLPDISYQKCQELAEQSRKFQTDNPGVVPKHIVANDYAVEVLSAIALKHQQILISNVDPNALQMFLQAVGLEKFFPKERRFAALSLMRSLYAAKQKILDKYLKHAKIQYDKIIVIGDSAKDLMHAPNSVAYLYTHPGKELREADADYKIQDLREILKEI